MYKVFLNDRIISIVAPGKITLRKTSKIVSDLESIETTIRWFTEFLKNKNTEVFLIQDNPGKYFTDPEVDLILEESILERIDRREIFSRFFYIG